MGNVGYDELSTAKRFHDIDWLRTICVWLVVLGHTAAIYVGGQDVYILHSDERSLMTDLVMAFLNTALMPLLIFLAGIGAFCALKKRDAKDFVKERFYRLLIPLAVGTLVCVPPMIYCQRLQEGSFTGSFFSFYPSFFHGIHPQGNFTYGHLWFLFYLFVFSLVCLPLFTTVYRRHGDTISTWLMKVASRPGALLLLCIPFVIIEATLRVPFPGLQYFINDWANVTRYILLYSFGFYYAATPGLSDAVYEQRRIWLGLAVIGTIAIAVVTELELLIPREELLPPLRYSPGFMIIAGVYGGPLMWTYILAILGYARKHLGFDHAILRRFAPISLPFYVIHQTILIPTGYFLLKAGVTLYPAFFIICSFTFVATWLVADFGIRPWKVARLCFGMKG